MDCHVPPGDQAGSNSADRWHFCGRLPYNRGPCQHLLMEVDPEVVSTWVVFPTSSGDHGDRPVDFVVQQPLYLKKSNVSDMAMVES